MNKNISVWRGIDPPPTNTHVWIKPNRTINIYSKGLWINVSSNSEELELFKLYILDMFADKVDVLNQSINSKQDKLVSGSNIKTINGQSILGDGDISNLAEKSYVDEVIQSRVFVGTQKEYDTAYAEGKIAIGVLVVILDGSETEEGGATISALLGTAILGQMLSGQK